MAIQWNELLKPFNLYSPREQTEGNNINHWNQKQRGHSQKILRVFFHMIGPNNA